MITNDRFDLPGNVLGALMHHHKIENVPEFTREHERRVSAALEKLLEEEGRLEEISDEREEELFDKLALTEGQWRNRLGIVLDSNNKTKRNWRTTFTQHDIEVLIFAGWFAEGSEWHDRFENAMKLQNALSMELVTFDELGSMIQVEQKTDVGRAYDAFSFAFFEFVRAHPETIDWSFHTMTAFASGLSKNALQALADLEVIELSDDWMDRLPGPEQTRGLLVPEEQEDWALLERIVDWVTLMLEDRLEGMRG